MGRVTRLAAGRLVGGHEGGLKEHIRLQEAEPGTGRTHWGRTGSFKDVSTGTFLLESGGNTHLPDFDFLQVSGKISRNISKKSCARMLGSVQGPR